MRARPLCCRARRPVRGAPERRRIPLPIPTTPAWGGRVRPAPASAVSWVRRPAAARSRKHPRISSPLPAFLDEGVDPRCAGTGARRLAAEQRPRWPGPARPHKPVTDEPRQPSVLPAFVVPGHGLQPRDRTSPIDDQHGRAVLETVDQGTQAVLGLSYAGFLHSASVATSKELFKPG